jgi:hypothetical protein
VSRADEPAGDSYGARVKAWVAGFEAIAEADREAWRRKGPDPAWAIRLALSMIDDARKAGLLGPGVPPWRSAEDEAVSQIWARLRRPWAT